MEDITAILNDQSISVNEKISRLKQKSIHVPTWGAENGLRQEYDPKYHPVMNKALYPDIVHDGKVTKVSRITCDLQKLAVKRMGELVCGIPIKRVYYPENDQQKEIAKYLEKMFSRCRIDSVNTERMEQLFASCETMTLWYAKATPNNLYGFSAELKMRCRTFSPMKGDSLYPLFDEYGDMIALSVAYMRVVGNKAVSYFDAYTEAQHIKYSDESGRWQEVENEPITLGKIPAIYMYRPTPIWENESNKVYEIEWTLSRNGNYIRENSRPIFVVCADEALNYGESPDDRGHGRVGKDILQLPAGGSAQFVTWSQSIENTKFQTEQLRSLFFTELQLPDWSYEKMSQQALSGESRKQMFIDAQLKVKDESGRIIEFLDREVNVVKSFLKAMLPDNYSADIDALEVENQITPFSITDEKDTIDKLLAANGGEPLISQRESIAQLGWSTDVDKTLQEIAEQGMNDAMGLSE